jgi:hypothetical protein
MFEFILKWSSNLLILSAALATSFDFIPLNKYLFLVGSITWTIVGFIWRQPSVWTGNLILSIIYLIGFFKL